MLTSLMLRVSTLMPAGHQRAPDLCHGSHHGPGRQHHSSRVHAARPRPAACRDAHTAGHHPWQVCSLELQYLLGHMCPGFLVTGSVIGAHHPIAASTRTGVWPHGTRPPGILCGVQQRPPSRHACLRACLQPTSHMSARRPRQASGSHLRSRWRASSWQR